jgi:glycerophosphoryl diester phosphodiesterase
MAKPVPIDGGSGVANPDVTPQQVLAAHQAGLQVAAWTANTPAQWDRLDASGVDAIVTDDPEALLEFLRQRGLHP